MHMFIEQIVAKPFGVVFLGAPGVGKGTFANKIGPMFGLTVFDRLVFLIVDGD